MPHFLLSAMASEQRTIDFQWPLSKAEATVESVSGTEALGRMYSYEVLLLSNSGDLAFDDLLGKHLTLKLELTGISGLIRRNIDGHIAQVGLVGMVDTLYRYRIVIKPWLWMLTRTRDCRIFQEKTTEDIVAEVFGDHGVADFEFQLTGNYPIREYCVQYRETDFDFVSRLLEEEGMYYFFKHDDGKHTMVVCDAPTAHTSTGMIRYRPFENQARTGDPYIFNWSVTREIQPGVAVLKDYNFKTPSVDLTAKALFEREHSESEHEVFDYPGEYIVPPDGEQLVKARLEEIQAAQEVIQGRGNSRLISSGSLFSLADYVRMDQNREFLVTVATVEAVNNLPELDIESQFTCFFQCMPSDMQFRTPRITPRPIVQGPQTAEVVGPSGEEIHVDEYGRVKVQFHWDRYGQHDDKSSCWVRVSQIWAGKNFGWITIPRIGQEVVVDFLEGNPDAPLITGRVYNAEQMPPWTLPDCKTQSGILTRSSKGGSPENANRLQFEDKKGEELVTIHAERNMARSVENDDSIHIGRDQMHVVKRNQVNVIEGHQKNQVTKFQETEVKEYRKITVKDYEEHIVDKAQSIKVGKTQSISVGEAQVTDFKDTFTLTVKSAIKTKGGDIRFDETAGNATTKVGGKQTTLVTGDFDCKAANMLFDAGNIVHKASKLTIATTGDTAMFANKVATVSNSNVETFALGSIKQTSMGSDTTVLGSSSDGYVGMSSSVRVGTHSETAISMDCNTFVGLASDFAVAIKSETFAGVHINTAIGAEVQMNTLTTFLPAGGGAAGPGTLGPAATAAAYAAMGVGAFATGFTSVINLAGLNDQYDTAAKELNKASEAAAEAGLPGLAARLSRLSSEAGLFDKGAAKGAATGAVIGTVVAGPAGGVAGAAVGGLIGTAPGDPGGSSKDAGSTEGISQQDQAKYASKDQTGRDWSTPGDEPGGDGGSGGGQP